MDVAAFSLRVKSDFPRQREQPARPPLMEERFDEAPVAEPFEFQIIEGSPMNRFWLLSSDESRLVQVQRDFFALNWRKMTESSQYPRYRQLRKSFGQYLKEFERVLVDEGKEPLRPQWCEVTYINHINPSAKGERRPLHEVLTIVRQPRDSFLPSPEDVQLAERFRVTEDNQPIGRLNVSAVPNYRTPDRAPIWVLTLTTRLRTFQPTVQGALNRLDLGHDWTLRAFKDLTTPRMHRDWDLKEETKEKSR